MKLDPSNMIGFSADGASVMMGKNSGVSARLKSLSPMLMENHCVVHRLNLAFKDADKQKEKWSNITKI
jgi:hypothetical protein